MPIYEYECENKHRFEKWQSMKDEAIKECPECGTLVRRIIHPAGIIFKGSGWYITDSRKSSGGESGESKSDKSAKSSDIKTEAKSDKGESKPESKSEPKSESKGDSTASSTSSKPSSSSE